MMSLEPMSDVPRYLRCVIFVRRSKSYELSSPLFRQFQFSSTEEKWKFEFSREKERSELKISTTFFRDLKKFFSVNRVQQEEEFRFASNFTKFRSIQDWSP